jgi:hypothetical protein
MHGCSKVSLNASALSLGYFPSSLYTPYMSGTQTVFCSTLGFRGRPSGETQPHFITTKLANIIFVSFDVRSSFFWDFTQRRPVVCCRRFGTTYRSHLQGSSSLNLEDGIDRLFRNVDKYHSRLRNISEDRLSHLHRGNSLIPCKI